MNPEARMLWTAALRSGKYRQGYGVERGITSDGDVHYCAFGVLGDVAQKALGCKLFVNMKANVSPEFTTCQMIGPMGMLAKWCGFDDYWAFRYNFVDPITRANDEGKTFAEIAAMVEEKEMVGV